MRCIPRRARQSIDRPRPIDETPVPARVPGERSRCWRCCWTLPELSAFSNRALSWRVLSLDANDVKEGTRALVSTVTTGLLDLQPLRTEDRENSSHAHKQDI